MHYHRHHQSFKKYHTIQQNVEFAFYWTFKHEKKKKFLNYLVCRKFFEAISIFLKFLFRVKFYLF